MRNHLPEYLSEFLGTAIMMTVGIGAIALMWGDGSPIRAIEMPVGLRRLLTGILFAAAGTFVALSPLGQRSGGHLNPAVTLAFWRRGRVKLADAILYSVAQCLGALAGVGLLVLIGNTFAKSVQLGLTVPGNGYSPAVAFLAEAVTTFFLMFLILYCVGNSRIAARTPYLAGALVVVLVFLEAPISGTSLNPARSFAPAFWMQSFRFQWIYWIAPVLGALAAVPSVRFFFRKGKKEGAPSSFTQNVTGASFKTAATHAWRRGRPCSKAASTATARTCWSAANLKFASAVQTERSRSSRGLCPATT